MNVFVTGGTSGIGRELARLYLTEGHRVGICGGPPEAFARAFPSPPPGLHFFELDVTDRQACKEVIGRFAGGVLDLVVACAGISYGRPDTDNRIHHEIERRIFDTNLYGVLNTFEAALDVMFPSRSGHLVAIASASGFAGFPQAPAYSASKAAVLTYCESLATRLRPEGIAVTAVVPGFVDTPLPRAVNPDFDRMPQVLTAAEAARRIKGAIAGGKELHVFPLSTALSSYIVDRMPRRLFRFLFRRR